MIPVGRAQRELALKIMNGQSGCASTLQKKLKLGYSMALAVHDEIENETWRITRRAMAWPPTSSRKPKEYR